MERSPADGLAVTDRTGTQIQRKLGPYIDTFLTSKLLAQLDGHMGDPQLNARVRQSLQKCVAKIEKNQMKDGSWNLSGGWAPILGTSMASQSLEMAKKKGVAVAPSTMARVFDYTRQAAAAPAGARSEASAGVSLYQKAQELEQLSRTDKDRKAHAKEIGEIKSQLADSEVCVGVRLGGRRGVLLLPQHQRQPEAHRRAGVGEVARRHAGPHRQNAECRRHVGRPPLHHGTCRRHQRRDPHSPRGPRAGAFEQLEKPMRPLCVVLLIAQAACVHSGRTPAERAADYLWSQQASDGGWHSSTYGLLRSGQSLTPFVLDALLEADPRPSARVDRAIDFIRRHTNAEGAVGLADDDFPDYPNYATALAVRVFARRGLQAGPMVTYLRAQQFTEQNGWRPADPAYGAWGMGGERRRPPETATSISR